MALNFLLLLVIPVFNHCASAWHRHSSLEFSINRFCCGHFDTVHYEALRDPLGLHGVPARLVSLLTGLYFGTML